jgi:hypothetical protein
MLSRLGVGACLLALLVGCSSGGGPGSGSSTSASTFASNDNEAQTPVMAVATLDGSGTPTALLIDTSQPSGSRVLDAVTVDANGNLTETGDSTAAENAADAVVANPNLAQPTTIPFGSSNTAVVAQQGQ